MSKIESSEIRELRKILDGITSHVKNTVAQCITAGKMLSSMKSKAQHGSWQTILEAVDLDRRTADRYMLLWEHRSELNLKEIKTITDAGKVISEICEKQPRQNVQALRTPTTQNEPVTEQVDTSVRQSSQAQNEPPKPTVFLDKVGRPIPDSILILWKHAHETGTRLRSAISAIKCELEKGIGHDKIFAELINSVISDAEALHYSLSQIVPFAVCPTCQGKLPERCTTCRHRGFISKFYWDGPAIGKDLRAIIQKQADKYASTTLSA